MKIYNTILVILLFIIISGVAFMVLDLIWDFISVELNNKIGKTLLIIIILFIILLIFSDDNDNSFPDPSMCG